jgi:predicted Rossmann-fold nucleotide-binding protein
MPNQQVTQVRHSRPTLTFTSRQPVAVLGGSKVKDEAYEVAWELGQELASRGLPVICGGRTGVMEAVCKGCSEAGGVSIGVLPEKDMSRANSYCSIVLPTDLGNAQKPLVPEGHLVPKEHKVAEVDVPGVSRNRVIVTSAFCAFVVNGSSEGTGDEVRLAREFKLRAFGLCNPAFPKEYPKIWVEGFRGLFSRHDTVRDAMKAFDLAFPRYSPCRL